MSDRPLANVNPILAGHDAGIYGLPEPVIRARVLLDRLNAFTPPPPPQLDQVERESIAALIAAAENDKPMPNVGTAAAKVEAAQRADADTRRTRRCSYECGRGLA